MKESLLSCLLVFCAGSVASANGQEVSVTFQVSAPTLKDSSAVYIVGDHTKLGNWDPSAVPLKKDKNGMWMIAFHFPFGTQLEYKFTKGSWGTEALTENGEIPPNNRLHVQQDTTITTVIEHWKDAFGYQITSQITGTVVYHREMKGEGIRPRNIIVWLPPHYEKDTDRRYPALYMHDGQNILDPATSFLGIDWQIDETADSLIRTGQIEPLIIVGMYNTPDRTAEYSPGPKGEAYMQFVVETVKPFIDRTYRTLPDRQHTAIAGSSMGGIISFMLLWEHTDIFSKAACFSPAFRIDNLDYTAAVEQYTGPKKDVKIYIDNGGLGLETRLQPGVDEMLAMLKRKGYEENRDFCWFVDKEAEHNEAAWARRAWRPLKLFFGKK